MGDPETASWLGVVGRAWWLLGLVHALSLLVYTLWPTAPVAGYVCSDTTRKPLQYRLNALATLLAVVAALALLAAADTIDPAFIADHPLACVAAANVWGLLGTAYFVLAYSRDPRRRALTQDSATRTLYEAQLQPGEASLFLDFAWGKAFNPRIGRLDVKMYLYAVGATLLECVLLSACYKHYTLHGGFSGGMLVFAALFSFFLLEFCWFECVHLVTYDIFAEKVGFKLVWGCTVFYPFAYTVGVWPLVSGPQSPLGPGRTALIVLLFFSGWTMTRGANMQKYYFKTDPARATVFRGLVQQRTIPDTRILCSGFWGVARHLNYLGEIVQAVALALPPFLATGSLVPWLYPLYYVALFIPRQLEDDALCAAKYGKAWQEYVKRVPWRIVPGVW